MLTAQHVDQQHPRAVHPFLHLVAILVCLIAISSVDLSGLPELLAVIAYEIIILAAVAAIIHWIYIARHRFPTVKEDN